MITIQKQRVRINEQINVNEVRLIDVDGQQIGVIPIKEALAKAVEASLNLIEVAPQAIPPVCRIMDYGKYKYQQNKKQQGAKRRHFSAQIKEIKIRPKIEKHDLEFKIRNTRRFLSDGNKVKISVIFRGREIIYSDYGVRILTQISDKLTDIAIIEQAPKLEGRNLNMVILPK